MFKVGKQIVTIESGRWFIGSRFHKRFIGSCAASSRGCGRSAAVRYIIYTVASPLAEHAQIIDMDQTAVEQTGELVHVHGGHVVHPGQVQSRRAGERVAGLRVGFARRVGRSSVIVCRDQYRLAIGGRAGIRSGTRSVRDDTARRRQNTREIHGRLFRTLPARKLQTLDGLAHRYQNTVL